MSSPINIDENIFDEANPFRDLVKDQMWKLGWTKKLKGDTVLNFSDLSRATAKGGQPAISVKLISSFLYDPKEDPKPDDEKRKVQKQVGLSNLYRILQAVGLLNPTEATVNIDVKHIDRPVGEPAAEEWIPTMSRKWLERNCILLNQQIDSLEKENKRLSTELDISKKLLAGRTG